MNDGPLVSVILIFLNAKRFIQEAIESVLDQSYNHWELLIVDDGSFDGSTTIARAYAEKYPQKIHYLEHPGHQNRGKSASRNLGINTARGDYIAFLDADDVWLPGKLKRQVEILQTQPEAGMLYGLSKWWYSWTGNLEDRQRDYVHELGVPADTLIHPPALLTPFFFSQSAAIPNPSNILVRRKTFTETGGFEDEVSGLYEDQAFVAKVCILVPVFASSECWDLYRQHPYSSSAYVERSGQETKERLIFLNWLYRYMEARGFRNSPAWRSLQKDIWQNRFPIFQNFRRGSRLLISKMTGAILWIGRRTIPAPIRSWLWARWTGQQYSPPVGWVRFGNLRRLTPFSREFGYDRGLPIDRYYIEKFLAEHQEDIQGHVLEIQDANYTTKYGGNRVTKSDVLHVEPGHAGTTIVADLTNAGEIESNTFDCIILTQTLQFIFDFRATLRTLYRTLKPGGVLIATFPGLSPISRYDMDKWGQYWSFTSLSARRIFEEVFPADQITVIKKGNVFSAMAFFYGIASEELNINELEHNDPDFEVIIAIRAIKE